MNTAGGKIALDDYAGEPGCIRFCHCIGEITYCHLAKYVDTVYALSYSCNAVVQYKIRGNKMAKPQRKPKTPARTINMPKSDYQPGADEKKQEVDMPGASLETVRKAFFRPVKSGE